MTDGSSRRGFLAGLLAVPAAFVGARALAATTRAAGALRPRARGRSSTRCAICGADDHAMLRCPRAPEVV